MKSIKQYKKDTIGATEKIMESEGLELVKKMDDLLSSRFSATLEEIQDESIGLYQKILMEALAHVQTFERYISLHIPQMEDGNNFGVTVQMTVSKFLNETREKWMKELEKIPVFYSSRADAQNKCLTVKTTSAETTTHTDSTTVASKEDVNENKKIDVTVKETKKSSDNVDKSMHKAHLHEINIQCFASIKIGLIDCMSSYMSILDNMGKNLSKLTNPKGSGVSMGMY